MKTKLTLFLVVIIFSNLLFAQSAKNENLKNRHSIAFYGGVKGNSGMEVASIPTKVNLKTGFTGGIDYGYWFSDEWLIGLNIGAVATNMNVNVANVESNAVVALQIGAKYYPHALKLGDVGRFYASLYAGPFIGVASKVSGFLGSTENLTETVVGGQLGVGVDLFILRWLKIGPAVNYSFMGDLEEISVEKKNFSGLGFVINFGIVL